MLKFKKKGFICSHESFKLDWFRKNTMVPITYLIDSNRLRVFLGMCDDQNIGRVGYIDVNPDNPSEIIDYSKEPCLDIGSDGSFDDNGAIPSGILEEGGKLYMFYSGYQKVAKVPYLIFAGLAVSEDQGKTFKRLSSAPFLDRSHEELSIRAAVHCKKESDGYKLWYLGGSDWVRKGKGSQIAPKYDIKYKFLEGDSILSIMKGFDDQVTSMSLSGDDEYGLSMPQVFEESGVYKMIYSIRTKSMGYRMGYAESVDNGKTWVRKDDQIELNVSDDGFDSQMVCFGHLQKVKSKTYMFYCGNDYGGSGIGYAELIK